MFIRICGVCGQRKNHIFTCLECKNACDYMRPTKVPDYDVCANCITKHIKDICVTKGD